MRIILMACLLIGFSQPLLAAETYDLVFKSGALDALEAVPAAKAEDTLVYDRVVSGTTAETDEPETFTVGLKVVEDDNVAMMLYQDGKHRRIGEFPASVGNPVIMYFLETALKDVAAQSGGSPFYIRNRIKNALLKDATVVPVSLEFGGRQIAAKEVTLHPLLNDPQKDKMGRFAKLALSVTVSDEIPGWYYSLAADVPAGSGPKDNAYSNVITLTPASGGKP